MIGTDRFSDNFDARADLPSRDAVAASRTGGASICDLGLALLGADQRAARALITNDPALAGAVVAERWTMIELAVASTDPAMIDLLIGFGAPPDGTGDGRPLRLALHASGPDLAVRLLDHGASAAPRLAPIAPLRTAITLGSIGGVMLLLDRGADPNGYEAAARTPLHIAADMERFAIAELLIRRGADPWAVDASGANLMSALVLAVGRHSHEDIAAKDRLLREARAADWPDPPPSPRALRQAVLAGAWPPPTARNRGAPAVAGPALDAIRAAQWTG